MSTLLEITNDLMVINQHLEQVADDESKQALKEKVQAHFDSVEEDLETKVAGYINLVREKELRAKAIKEEIARLRADQQAYENAAKSLKENLKFNLQRLGKDKVETNRGTASIQANGGKRPVDIQIPAEELPEAYQKHVIDYDKSAIYDALEAGEQIDGCTLMERGTSLRIR